MEYRDYRLFNYCYYNDVFVEIVIAEIHSTYDEAERLANGHVTVILKNDSIELFHNDKHSFIQNTDRELYQFEVCTKLLPQPIDPRILTDDQKTQLIDNEEYMCTSDDFENVEWSISEAYEKLKSLYPNKAEFYLSSLSYRIEEIEVAI